MLEILTPCRDQSHDEERCAVHCPEPDEPVWNEFLGGWFHVEQLLTPQERTARAHAQQQREQIIADQLREAQERIYSSRPPDGYVVFTEVHHWPDASGPSGPGTTIPPQLDP